MGMRLVPDKSQLCNEMAENDFICRTIKHQHACRHKPLYVDLRDMRGPWKEQWSPMESYTRYPP